jgi:two-component system phosphate regulon sensor histidine kinase PhoR
MGSNRSARILTAAAIAAFGLSLSLASTGGLLPGVVALLAGAAAFAFLFPRVSPLRAETPAEEVKGLPVLPGVSDLLAAIDDPTLIVRNRRVLLANAAAREVLGEHIEGVDVRLAIRHPAAAERLTDRARDEAPETVTRTELVGLGQRERRWEMATALLPDGSRLVRLTDRSEAFASEKMRGDFVANASHELRTPLATLLGFLETLQDDEAASDPKTRARFLAIMFEEAQRMHRLVDDLISLSRIEAERFTVPRDSVDLRPLVQELRKSCARMIDDKKSEIVVDAGTVEPIVLGDEAQLQQLLQNLVMNALKYGRPGAPVTIRFEDAGPELLRMSVVDEGDGIPPEHLPRLTERFYRVDAGRSRAVGGTGLGLAIVKHIVGRHRGRLDIRSTLGEGTSVRVYLPKAQPVADAAVMKES